MPTVALFLGALLTLAGAATLVMAYRHGAEGRKSEERRGFRLAIGLFAAGSLTFVVATALTVSSV